MLYGFLGIASRRSSLTKSLFVLSSVCFSLSVAEAKTLYVDASAGNDSTSYAANSSSNPWASLGRAVWGSTSLSNPNSGQAARAGDVVVVRSGTYNTSQVDTDNLYAALSPVNSGTSENPIVFRAEGDVVLTLITTGGEGALLGANNNSHIVWDGFILDEININSISDSGLVMVFQSDNITLQNLTIRGERAPWNDNHSAIRLEHARNILIRNNTLSGIRNAGNNRNGSAIMTYAVNDVVIENNEISDGGTGIFIKGNVGGPVTIRYNYIYGMSSDGVAFGGIGTQNEQYGARMYQNIVRDSASCVTFNSYDIYSPANVDVVNNTLHNCSHGGIFIKNSTIGNRDLVFANNIIVGSTLAVQGEDAPNVSFAAFRNNLYHGNSTHARIAGTNYSFLNWQNTFGQDVQGSLTADPAFANTADNTFTITSESPAINAGVDILNLQGQGTGASINMGARVTGNEVIGVSSGNTGNVQSRRYTILNPAMTSSAVVSLVDNNTITAGGITLNLDRYEWGGFYANTGALTQGIEVTSTGPFEMGSGRSATDMPAHGSMEGTQFAMPHFRYHHRYYMVSPHADATAWIGVGGAQATAITLPQNTVVEFDAGGINGPVSTVITADSPILVTHKGVAGTGSWYADVSPMAPAATELWGIKSNNAYLGAVEDNTTVRMYASDGTSRTIRLNAGEKRYINVGSNDLNRSQGRGSAIRLVSDKPISAVQISDGDGVDQTAFFPTSMLSTRFGLPKHAQYIAVACPEEGTNVTLYNGNNAPLTRRCNANGNFPGKAYFGSANSGTIVARQGAYLESNNPVYVIYEVRESQGEHNLMGTRQP